MKVFVIMIAIFCQVSAVQANEQTSSTQRVSNILVETIDITSGSLVVCANGEDTGAASTSLARTLARGAIEIRSAQSVSMQTVLRMEKPYSHISAPAISIDNGKAFGKAEICVTVTNAYEGCALTI